LGAFDGHYFSLAAPSALEIPLILGYIRGSTPGIGNNPIFSSSSPGGLRSESRRAFNSTASISSNDKLSHKPLLIHGKSPHRLKLNWYQAFFTEFSVYSENTRGKYISDIIFVKQFSHFWNYP